jgi:hypothetical protein
MPPGYPVGLPHPLALVDSVESFWLIPNLSFDELRAGASRRMGAARRLHGTASRGRMGTGSHLGTKVGYVLEGQLLEITGLGTKWQEARRSS